MNTNSSCSSCQCGTKLSAPGASRARWSWLRFMPARSPSECKRTSDLGLSGCLMRVASSGLSALVRTRCLGSSAMAPSSGGFAQILAGQRTLDQAHDIVAAVELDEGTHTPALLAAQKHLVERLEPLAQLGLGEVTLAHLVDLVLDELRALLLGQLAQGVGEIF